MLIALVLILVFNLGFVWLPEGIGEKERNVSGLGCARLLTERETEFKEKWSSEFCIFIL